MFFERALAELGKRAFNSEQLFVQFIKFEIRQKEYQRVRTLFEYALKNLGSDKTKQIQDLFS